MRARFLTATLILAACAPQVLAAGGLKAPDLKLTVTQSPDPGKPGAAVKISVAVEPPEGIKLNQYPGITLKVTPPAGLTLDSNEAFVGTKKPIDDPEQFGFKHIDPLVLQGKVGGGGTKTLEGTLSFFYCVKASGYCAPGKMPVKIPVKVAG